MLLRILGWLALLLAAPARAGEVQVAVASNFAAPMQRIVQAFERSAGHRVRLAVGSTGKFYAQIRQGAPFELLLAADAATPQRLEAEGLAVAGTRATYALGALVLWSREPGLVDAEGRVLRGDGFRRLAIADPVLAPYGAAAMQTLQALGQAQRLAPRLVRAESIGQAFQFVATGNAELGLVAQAQLAALPAGVPAGSAWPVPPSMHAPIQQDAVLLRAGRDNAAARELLAFLAGDAGRAIILAYGYRLP